MVKGRKGLAPELTPEVVIVPAVVAVPAAAAAAAALPAVYVLLLLANSVTRQQKKMQIHQDTKMNQNILLIHLPHDPVVLFLFERARKREVMVRLTYSVGIN